MSFCQSKDPSLSLNERLRILYPKVNEEKTPLPRCWSNKVSDRYHYIRLHKNYLRIEHIGKTKSMQDASSIRTKYPIPGSCGIFYFEVKFMGKEKKCDSPVYSTLTVDESKSRDGYMGVGLSAQGVNMNRLPGWDKHSYGYHGDDGNSFCSSGTGQAYGPTFTTNDIIGCGLNLIDRSCFYTKNGHNLGVAFTDLPAYLYPTVGLQTPGEVVDANFGQEPFVFDIEGEMYDYRSRTHRMVEQFPPPGKHGDWQLLLHKMVSSYLIHQGFSSTAEAFARTAGQDIDEDITSIQNRQAIQKLVLAGRMGDAITMTNRLYPGFLQRHPSLHFMLKVRQFIEMVSGNDTSESEVVGQGSWSNSSLINSATSAYQGSHPLQELKNTSIASSTETQFRSGSQGTMQDNTLQTGSNSRGTAIPSNSTSAPNSLTFEESTMSSIGNRPNVSSDVQEPGEEVDRIMEDTMMDSHPEGQISSSPISSSTVPNGSSASNTSSSSSSRSGDTTSQSVEPSGNNPIAHSNISGGSPLRHAQATSSNQNQEQMQTAVDSNIAFSNLTTVENVTQRNSSSTNIQNNSINSARARESVTDDEDLPQNPLQRESSSEGVFEVDENQMDVDQQSSSSSITASVPVAPTSSSHQMSDDNVSAGNVHQNGYRNGSIQQGGTGANSRLVMNGNLNTNNSSQIDISTTPEGDVPQQRSLSVVSNPERFNRLIVFGRQLQAMLQDLETSQGVKTDKNTKMLQDAFALLAYPNPWESPVGWQLESTEREFVSSSLNSAILESQCNQPGRPPLQVSLTHAKQLIKLMANNDLGACAFADVDDFLK